MQAYALYIASVFGAVAMLMILPRRGYTPAKFGALLGAAVLGALWLHLAPSWPADPAAFPSAARAYYYLFSAIAVGAAVRVISHRKPVYSALWFIMVVLASAGLFLVLSAEFMAFALVIIYGGAILVTYVFVIMLAAQESPGPPSAADGQWGPQPGQAGEIPEYDRVAREPAAAVAVGFLLLAVLLSVAFQPMAPNPAAAGPTDRQLIARDLPRRAAQRLTSQLQTSDLGLTSPAGAPPVIPVDRLDNAERVGLDLFQSHPLGLELAGVILLVSLVGAVVIAKKRLEETAPLPQPDQPAAGPPSDA